MVTPRVQISGQWPSVWFSSLLETVVALRQMFPSCSPSPNNLYEIRPSLPHALPFTPTSKKQATLEAIIQEGLWKGVPTPAFNKVLCEHCRSMTLQGLGPSPRRPLLNRIQNQTHPRPRPRFMSQSTSLPSHSHTIFRSGYSFPLE